jgi:hypothetical protein
MEGLKAMISSTYYCIVIEKSKLGIFYGLFFEKIVCSKIGVSHFDDCSSYCNKTEGCKWFTHNQETSSCHLFATCNSFYKNDEGVDISRHLSCKQVDGLFNNIRLGYLCTIVERQGNSKLIHFRQAETDNINPMITITNYFYGKGFTVIFNK